MRYPVILVLMLLTIASCAKYKTHQFPESGEKDFHVDFYSKSGKDQLKYAKQFSGEGDYKTAIDLFLKIYVNNEIDSNIRQEALLNLGNTYSNVLYAGRDFERALYYWETLLDEFPDTTFLSNALESIDNTKKLMQQK